MKIYPLLILFALSPTFAEDEPLGVSSIEDSAASFQPEESLLPLQAEEQDLSLMPFRSRDRPKEESSPSMQFNEVIPQIQGAEAITAITAPPSGEPLGGFVDKVVLGALDKVTARVSHLTVRVGESVPFGSLTIMVKKCWQAAPEDTPETKAFLEITEAKPNKTPIQIFRGWMFASNPSVITLEHPVYDVWVARTKGDDSQPSDGPVKDEASQKLDQLLEKLFDLPED